MHIVSGDEGKLKCRVKLCRNQGLMDVRFSHKIWTIVQRERGEQISRMPTFKEITEKEILENMSKRLNKRQEENQERMMSWNPSRIFQEKCDQ